MSGIGEEYNQRVLSQKFVVKYISLTCWLQREKNVLEHWHHPLGHSHSYWNWKVCGCVTCKEEAFEFDVKITNLALG